MFYYKSIVPKPNIRTRLLTQSTYFLARVFNSTLLNVLSHLRLWRCYLICFTASQRCAIQVVSQQVDQIVERERRAEAERERLGEAERDVNPTPSSSSSEESREAATEAEAARSLSLTSDSDTNQTSETSSDVTVQTGTDSDSTHTELSRTRENAAKDQELDPYEVDQLLEAMRSQSRLSVPESDVISTRSARVRSPPPTEDEQSTAAVTRTVSALEWDDVSTARVAPSEENLLASSNSPALVANPAGTVVPELPANNDDIPTAIEADK
uniref:Uncharacterized protein n=1 Tax=Meloidogyne incognita TaxID=6306 RepID=A0A914MTC6_MELIC